MSFFSNLLSNLQFTKPTPTNLSRSNIERVPKLSEIESLTDSSSCDESVDDYSDINSEADINTIQMVQVMTGFHQNGVTSNEDYKKSLENGELHQKLSSLRDHKRSTPLNSAATSANPPHEIDLVTAKTMVLETDPEKIITNGTKVCKKKYGITKRNRYIHEDMWSKSRV